MGRILISNENDFQCFQKNLRETHQKNRDELLPSHMHKALEAIKTGVLSGLPAWGTPASTLRARESGMQYPTQPGPTPPCAIANCAQSLADAYTVCAHCEPEFSTTWDNRWRAPERAQQPALHTCAQCGFGFDVASVRLQPDPAPWWRMQTMAHCCRGHAGAGSTGFPLHRRTLRKCGTASACGG